jgi:hypothetical protein
MSGGARIWCSVGTRWPSPVLDDSGEVVLDHLDAVPTLEIDVSGTLLRNCA